MNFSKKGSRSFAALLTTIAVTCTATTTVLANGTEQLGDRDIPIASGSGFVCAGTGLGGPILGLVNSATALQGSVPGTIDIDVPAGASIQQVLLYWQGTQTTARGAGRMDTITLNPGGQVTGQRIGGPVLFFTIPVDGWASSYRADITGLNIIQPGSNSIDVCCTDFDVANNGAGIVVIYDDGSGASNIQIADGCDTAFVNFPPPRDTTAPVAFDFAPSDVDRTANLCVFVGSVALRAGGGRPSIIKVWVDGNLVEQFNDVLDDVDGPEWDTFQTPISVPAGASSLAVQILSEDSGVGPFAGDLPASLIWVTATFSIGEQQPCTGRIGDFIWNDLNGNGIQDAGEPGLPGVTVRLFEKLDDGGLQQVGQTTTNAAGLYLFSDLCAGNYRVQVVQDTLPPNFEASPPNQGDDDTKDSDCEGGAAQVTLPTDSTIDLTVDCGFVRKGACCLDDGRCVRVTQINCNEQGGAYQGDGTTCDQVECPFRKGACCFSDGSCAVVNEESCFDQEGDYQGDSTNCATAECPQPQGACCLESGDCVQATQAGCNAQGGDWQGPGTNCKAADCFQIKGACCLTDGSCTVVTLEACIGLSGAYEGDDTTCQSTPCPAGNGACCLGDGSCVEVTQAQCNAMLAAYQGNGTGCAGVNCVETKGVCCFADGSCAVETLAECIAMSGAYQGDGTTCQSVNCPAPDGACCFEDGSCQELTQSACNGAGGSYQGNDSRCDGANCVVVKGACCFADGSCAAETLEACIAQAGAYQGDDTTCQSANCPIPDGACCFDDGSCLTLSQSLCNADGGAYQGNGTRCSGIDCRQTKGACCFDDGSCSVITLDACIQQSGAYQGDTTTCQGIDCPAPNGACCLNNGQCITTTQAACNAMLASWQGPGTDCASVDCPLTKGACCFAATGACSVITLEACIASGGAYQGDGTTCQSVNCPIPTGACCMDSGFCFVATQASCNAQSGSYQGNATVCAAVNCNVEKGACCFNADGSCAVVTLEQCIVAGGAYQGDGSNCAIGTCDTPEGACCLDNGDCTVATQAGCNAQGGAYQGNGTVCAAVFCPVVKGACCFENSGSCAVVTLEECITLGGAYQGDGSTCQGAPCGIPTGACCLADGSCEIRTQEGCNLIGGLYQGNNTSCTPNPCPEVKGACCFENDGSCAVLTEQQCDTASGDYQGDGSTCASVECPQPTGACCLPDLQGACLTGVTQANCLAQNGLYQGNFTTCAEVSCVIKGACCFPDGSCAVVDAMGVSAACETLGGQYQGDGVTCGQADCEPPTGGCCFPATGECNVLTQEECNAQSGQYQGNFTGCDPNNCTTIKGACCFDDGTCVVVEAASLFEDCIQLDGFYQGDGTFCNADQCIGACCLPDGSCVDQIPRAECQNVLLGSWQGLGLLCGDIVCPPTKGACCLSNGDCLNDVTEAECTAANGIDFQVGVTCAEKDCDVPCCVPDDPCCIKVSLDECVAQDGIAGPVGVSCDDYECPPQACCFDDGSCQDLTCEECVALGGRTQGFGSSCATTICCDGAIGDFIWLDNSFAGSCNGKQDAGEPGIAGVVVTLYRQLADGSLEFVQETVTNSSGHYLFSGPDICAGDYCVEVQTPMGLYPTTPFAGNDPAKDSDCFNGLACLTLPTSVSEDLTIDCGFCMPEDCCEPDKPKALTFRYTGEDCSATDNTQGDGDDCEDFGNLPDTVYIVAGKQSDCDNNADETYFEGTVSVGEDFTIARPDGGDFASNTYFCIYNSQGGQLKQTIKIHTSCSKDLISGQQFGSLILISCGGAGGNFDCDGKIVQMTMIWDGNQPVTIIAYDGSVGSQILLQSGVINPGDEVTVGPLNGPNDSIWEIFSAATGQKIGESKFHRSCSDSDMNGPEDCGKAEGNGKQNDSNFLNDWILEGLVDEAGQVLDCSEL